MTISDEHHGPNGVEQHYNRLPFSLDTNAKISLHGPFDFTAKLCQASHVTDDRWHRSRLLACHMLIMFHADENDMKQLVLGTNISISWVLKVLHGFLADEPPFYYINRAFDVTEDSLREASYFMVFWNNCLGFVYVCTYVYLDMYVRMLIWINNLKTNQVLLTR